MEKIFPTITLSSQQLAMISEMEVGEECCLEISVIMTGKRKAESYDLPTQDGVDGRTPNNNIMIGNFDIKDIQCCDEMEEEDDSTETEDDMANYESDYAMKMQPKDQTITIKLVK